MLEPAHSNFHLQQYNEAVEALSKESSFNYSIVRKALEVLKQGQYLPEQADIPYKIQINLKKLEESIQNSESILKNSLLKDLDDKIQTVFKEKLTHVPTEVLSYITEFTGGWKDKQTFLYINKEFYTLMSQKPERQIIAGLRPPKDPTFATLLKEIISCFSCFTIPKAPPSSSLNLPEGYLENLSYASFKKLMPPSFSTEIAVSFIYRAASFKPGSGEEKLALYLMKNEPWDVEPMLKQEWSEHSAIESVIEDIVRIFKSENLDKVQWEVMQYEEASFNNQLLKNLAFERVFTNHYQTHEIEYISHPEVLLAAIKYNTHIFHFVKQEMKDNKEFVLKVIDKVGGSDILHRLNTALQLDEEILAACESYDKRVS